MKNLMKNENVILESKYSKIVYVAPIIIGLLTLFTIIIPIMMLFVWFTLSKSSFIITNKRVIKRSGLFTIKSEEFNINKIESVYSKSDIFGIGGVIINGTGGGLIKINNINNTQEFTNTLQEIIHE